MAYTFAVDSGKITDLADSLEKTRTGVGEGIDSIYNQINKQLPNSWSGESYDTFAKGAGDYSDALKNVPDVVGAFENTLRGCIDPANNVVDEIEAAINGINS